MRKIKFRIRNPSDGKIETNKKQFFINLDGKVVDGNGDSYDEHYIIETYTGLKDKYDKEIYEGDIVKSIKKIGKKLYDDGKTFLICYNKFLCNYSIDLEGMDFYNKKTIEKGNEPNTFNSEYKEFIYNDINLTGAKAKNIMVIGNIYENPELLNINSITENVIIDSFYKGDDTLEIAKKVKLLIE